MPKERTVGIVENAIGATGVQEAAEIVTRLLMGAEGAAAEVHLRGDEGDPRVVRLPRQFCLAATDLIGTMARFGTATTFVMMKNKNRPATEHGFIWLGPEWAADVLAAYAPEAVPAATMRDLAEVFLDIENGRSAEIVVPAHRAVATGAPITCSVAAALADLSEVLSRPYLMAVVTHPTLRLKREQARTLGSRRTPELVPDPDDPLSDFSRLGRFMVRNISTYLAEHGVPHLSPRRDFTVEAPTTFRRRNPQYKGL